MSYFYIDREKITKGKEIAAKYRENVCKGTLTHMFIGIMNTMKRLP